MLRMKDYYMILSVPRDAEQEDIRRAHREQALRTHPDRSHDPDPERFLEAQEAYEVLRDSERRARYNRDLKDHEEWVEGNRPVTVHGGPLPIWEDFATVFPGLEEILDHIRSDFFGPLRKAQPLRHLNVEFILDPDEAASGGVVPLEVPVYEFCPRCGGRGGAFPFACLLCDGRGLSWGKRTLPVRFPPGVRDGTVLRIPLENLGVNHLHLTVHFRVEPAY